MNRPGGVTVIAILDFIGAALCLLMGILSVVGAGAGIMGAMGQVARVPLLGAECWL